MKRYVLFISDADEESKSWNTFKRSSDSIDVLLYEIKYFDEYFYFEIFDTETGKSPESGRIEYFLEDISHA